MHPGEGREEVLPARYSDYPLADGDIFRLETPGGGGFGAPGKRDPQRVCVDVTEGYVTPKAAREVYRVALRKSKGVYRVDQAKTKALRKRR